jgi:hypothetical protein
MASIYKNSRLTIVASAAPHAMQGFLLSPKQQLEPLARLQIDDSTESTNILNIHTNDERGYADQSMQFEPIEYRAWCLQEGILSPRCLVYSDDVMHWRCQQLSYARSDGRTPEDLGSPSMHVAAALPGVMSSGRRGAMLTSEDRLELFQFWERLVRHYSQRKVSQPQDRFRAFAGLVEEIQAVRGDRYLAGLWERDDMCESLLWRTGGPVSDVFAAPSWSWLSIPKQISPGSIEADWTPEAQMLGCDVQPLDPSEPFGSIRGGCLRIRGRLTQVLVWHGGLQNGGFSYFRCRLPEKEEPGSSHQDDATTDLPSAFIDHARHPLTGKPWEEYKLGSEAMVWAFLLARSTQGPDSTGLLLVESDKDRNYQRAGMFISTAVTTTSYSLWPEDGEPSDITLI